ncbi:hypothetical protein C8R44DRAFT_891261 [Mycena epipterygia]|nr:hypothetical protein C8R44DRAFT_891261 [Mycena epipterygia]
MDSTLAARSANTATESQHASTRERYRSRAQDFTAQQALRTGLVFRKEWHGNERGANEQHAGADEDSNSRVIVNAATRHPYPDDPDIMQVLVYERQASQENQHIHNLPDLAPPDAIIASTLPHENLLRPAVRTGQSCEYDGYSIYLNDLVSLSPV